VLLLGHDGNGRSTGCNCGSQTGVAALGQGEASGIRSLDVVMAVPLLEHLLPLGLQAHIGSSKRLSILHQALIRSGLFGHIVGNLLHDLLLEISLVILVAAGRQLAGPKTTRHIGGTAQIVQVSIVRVY